MIKALLYLLVAAQFCRCAGRAEAVATFGLTNIWTIELNTTPEVWHTLASVTSPRVFVRPDVTINGKAYANVEVRQKGGGTSGGTSEGRPPLRLAFNGMGAAGVHRLSLNNNYFDNSYLRDVLSYKLCNDFGLQAPKTAFAKIYVRTSEGEKLRYLGLYTATEIVDDAYMQQRFGPGGGLLMKPNGKGFTGARTWGQLEGRVMPRRRATEAEQSRILAFIALCNEGSDEEFARDIESYLDLENYLRFIVVNVALSNLDSYLGMSKNYYLYLNAANGKLTWIPWDFDLSFGGFFLAGTPEQRVHLSIDRPSTVDDSLIERLLVLPKVKERYRALLREFVEKHFQVASIERQIDELVKIIEPAVLEESRPARSAYFRTSLGTTARRSGGWAIDIGLKTFVEGRVESINEQLEGKSRGERPRFGSPR